VLELAADLTLPLGLSQQLLEMTLERAQGIFALFAALLWIRMRPS
jgi:hypothetical protein